MKLNINFFKTTAEGALKIKELEEQHRTAIRAFCEKYALDFRTLRFSKNKGPYRVKKEGVSITQEGFISKRNKLGKQMLADWGVMVTPKVFSDQAALLTEAGFWFNVRGGASPNTLVEGPLESFTLDGVLYLKLVVADRAPQQLTVAVTPDEYYDAFKKHIASTSEAQERINEAG